MVLAQNQGSGLVLTVPDGIHECLELGLVQRIRSSHPRAQVQPVRLDLMDGLADITSVEPASEVNGPAGRPDD